MLTLIEIFRSLKKSGRRDPNDDSCDGLKIRRRFLLAKRNLRDLDRNSELSLLVKQGPLRERLACFRSDDERGGPPCFGRRRVAPFASRFDPSHFPASAIFLVTNPSDLLAL